MPRKKKTPAVENPAGDSSPPEASEPQKGEAEQAPRYDKPLSLVVTRHHFIGDKKIERGTVVGYVTGTKDRSVLDVQKLLTVGALVCDAGDVRKALDHEKPGKK